MAGTKRGMPFERTGPFPIDDKFVLSNEEMLAVDDLKMPEKYFAVNTDDGKFYLYDKSATASAETGKFSVVEGGGGDTEHMELTQAEYDALTDEEKLNGTVYFITDGEGGGGGGSYVLPTATAERLGGIKVGEGLSVEADGTLSATGGQGLPAGGTEGQSLVKKSDADYDTEWKTMPDSQTVLNMLLKLAPPRPFSDATWEEISTYIDWHKQGLMNLYDYWNVGDTKVIHMGPYMSSTFPEKDVEIMLVGTDSRPLSDGSRSTFIWQQRYVLDTATTPPASATIAGYYQRLNEAVLQADATYNNCMWKNRLDVDYFNALPAEMRALCKEMRISLDNFLDGAVYTGKVVLPSEFEIFGTRTHDREASSVKQFEYYAAQTNKSFIRRATYNSSSKEYTYEDTAGWLRSRDVNPGNKWTYNNRGVVAVSANTASSLLGILPTGAF